MPEQTPAPITSEIDTNLLEKLSVAERISLAAVISIVILNLSLWASPLAEQMVTGNWRLMTGGSILAAVLCVLSLHFSASPNSEELRRLGLLLAFLVALFYTANLVFYLLLPSLGIDFPIPSSMKALRPFAAGISPQATSSFAMLGLTTIFINVRSRAAVLVADLLTGGLVLLVLTVVSGQMIGMMPVFRSPANFSSSAQTVVCLLLLVGVAFFRRARSGMFSILVRHGAGSRLARTIAPILLVAPFLRELTRAHFINSARMPPQYTTAVLASLAVMFSLAVVLFFAWRINSMEVELHALSLRDELTGLYNLRGFRLLAEQAMRMADRSARPFSVLYVDVDDLKQINDELGHQAGSMCLIEIAETIKSAFRESDVIGRIGGDEFAVAGEFSNSAIRSAALRLEHVANHRSAGESRQPALTFSIGHVTAGAEAWESLDTLLAKADEAMYEEKRRKKEVTV